MHSEFEASLGYLKPCVKKMKNKTKPKTKSNGTKTEADLTQERILLRMEVAQDEAGS